MCPQIDAFLKWRSRRKGVGGVGIRADTDGQAGIQKDSLTGKHTDQVSHHLALGRQESKPRKAPASRVCAVEAATTAIPVPPSLRLPAVCTLRGWFRSVDGNLGFNASVMQSLENKVKEARKQGNEVLCSLMQDEMAIMKKIEFDEKKTFGFVDIGSGVTDDGAPAATGCVCVWLLESSYQLFLHPWQNGQGED
ncbi:THAP domain containing 9 [Plakobranchus ocellatus]|uniref:THAP domain containing 9 n=1 Tax=Plakobranchus ocellatus TaxID=259542 RepID=A0AAV4AU33_9GAST|nr:THAP domain containing 9 [Plakobranchus ocellatus]